MKRQTKDPIALRKIIDEKIPVTLEWWIDELVVVPTELNWFVILAIIHEYDSYGLKVRTDDFLVPVEDALEFGFIVPGEELEWDEYIKERRRVYLAEVERERAFRRQKIIAKYMNEHSDEVLAAITTKQLEDFIAKRTANTDAVDTALLPA